MIKGATMHASALFHLAFPVHDLAATRQFYGSVIGCAEGRSSDAWIDFNFYGHQLVAHLAPHECHIPAAAAATNAVDGRDVPVRQRDAGIDFVIEPHIRFPGLPGEQSTMFFLDPSGNALEFKAFADLNQVFAK
jgi:extradiol dioxygenase family protein